MSNKITSSQKDEKKELLKALKILKLATENSIRQVEKELENTPKSNENPDK